MFKLYNVVGTQFWANCWPAKLRSVPPALAKADAAEQRIRPKLDLTDAQPEEPGGSGAGHEYQAGAGPKVGPNMVNYRVHMEPYSDSQGNAPCCQPPHYSLHIPGPSQCPRVEKPHPASVSGTRPAVAGCTRKDIAQVVLNGSGISVSRNRRREQE
jgi:hypothetical protein